MLRLLISTASKFSALSSLPVPATLIIKKNVDPVHRIIGTANASAVQPSYLAKSDFAVPGKLILLVFSSFLLIQTGGCANTGLNSLDEYKEKFGQEELYSLDEYREKFGKTEITSSDTYRKINDQEELYSLDEYQEKFGKKQLYSLDKNLETFDQEELSSLDEYQVKFSSGQNYNPEAFLKKFGR